MNRYRHACKLVAGLLMWACVSPSVVARTLTLEVDRLTTPVARLDGVVLALHWPEEATQGELSLKSASLDAGELGYRWRDVRWSCELHRSAAGDWQCAGKLKARGASGLNLSARLEAGALVLEASEGSARIVLNQPRDSAAPTRLELVRLPATWLPLACSTKMKGPDPKIFVFGAFASSASSFAE